MLAEGIIEQQRVEDYLEKVHDIDYSDIAADASLRDMLGKCVTKDRRHVFTVCVCVCGVAYGCIDDSICMQIG